MIASHHSCYILKKEKVRGDHQMKNLLCLMLCILLIFSLSACSQLNAVPKETSFGYNHKRSLAKETNGCEEIPAPYISDYREYRNYIKANDAPQQFVSFQKINFEKKLSFKSFLLADYSGEYAYYDYSMYMSNGERIDLRVNHAGYHDKLFSDKPVIERPTTMEDMRDMPSNELAVIYIDDIQYVYLFNREGKATLYAVTFVIDEIQFRWTFNAVNEFPKEKDTFIERLLHASTATEARDEFAAAIRGQHPSQVVRQVLMWGIPAFVVIGLGAFGIIYRRKCKRTSK